MLGGLSIAVGVWFRITKATPAFQETVLTTGWSVVTVIALVLTGFALIRLLQPTRGYRP